MQKILSLKPNSQTLRRSADRKAGHALRPFLKPLFQQKKSRSCRDSCFDQEEERMNYIRITKENIDKEHICCAMSGKQSVAKKRMAAAAL